MAATSIRALRTPALLLSLFLAPIHAWADLGAAQDAYARKDLAKAFQLHRELAELDQPQLSPNSLQYSAQIQSQFGPAALNARLMPQFLQGGEYVDRDPVRALALIDGITKELGHDPTVWEVSAHATAPGSLRFQPFLRRGSIGVLGLPRGAAAPCDHMGGKAVGFSSAWEPR